MGSEIISNKKIKNFILFEKDLTLKNDKTYSFWSGPELFDIRKKLNIKIKKEWSQIEIKVKNDFLIMDSRCVKIIFKEGEYDFNVAKKQYELK